MSTELDDSVRRVYLALRQRISSGELAPDKRLPSYGDLTEEFQVNDDLVRMAIRQLQIEGYVYQKPGLLFWFVKPRSSSMSRRRFLGLLRRNWATVVLGGLVLEVVGGKIESLFPDVPSFGNKSTKGVKTEGNKEHQILASQTALRDLWNKTLTLREGDMSEVQAEAVPKTWFEKYEPVNKAHRLGIETILKLIQELSLQESEKDRSKEREIFLDEAMEKAVEAQGEGAVCGPLQHYVQLRQVVLLRQRGRPHSQEHEHARNFLTALLQETSSFAISSEHKLSWRSCNWTPSNGTSTTLLSKRYSGFNDVQKKRPGKLSVLRCGDHSMICWRLTRKTFVYEDTRVSHQRARMNIWKMHGRPSGTWKVPSVVGKFTGHFMGFMGSIYR